MLRPAQNSIPTHLDGFMIHALHVLAEGLLPYAAEKTRDGTLTENPTVSAILGTMDDKEDWERHFQAPGPEVPGWIKETRRMSDAMAHAGGYSVQDIHRTLDTIRRLLGAISPDRRAAEIAAMGERVGELIYRGPGDNLQIASVFFNWGQAHYETADYDAAIADYTEAIRLVPQFDRAHTARGNAYAKKDWIDLAIEDFSRVIDLNPDSAVAYGNRGASYARKDEQHRAIEDFNEAIRLNPDYPLTYGSRGMAYLRTRKYDQAIEDMSRAIAAYPEWAALYNDRGRAYFHKQEYDRAIQDFDKAIELVPDGGAAYSNRGWCHDRKNEPDPAMGDYNAAIDRMATWDAASNDADGSAWRPTDIDDTVARAFYRRGLIHWKRGDYGEAIDDFDEALRLNPPGALVYFETEGVPDHLRISTDSAARFMLGRAYTEIGDRDAAIDNFKAVIGRDERWGLPNYYLARLYEDQAMDRYDLMIQLHEPPDGNDCNDGPAPIPEHVQAHYRRALIHEMQGEEDYALADYSEVILLKPDHAEACYRRALIYEIQGMADEAADDYEAVLKIDPEHTKARRNLDRLRPKRDDPE